MKCEQKSARRFDDDDDDNDDDDDDDVVIEKERRRVGTPRDPEEDRRREYPTLEPFLVVYYSGM